MPVQNQIPRPSGGGSTSVYVVISRCRNQKSITKNTVPVLVRYDDPRSAAVLCHRLYLDVSYQPPYVSLHISIAFSSLLFARPPFLTAHIHRVWMLDTSPGCCSPPSGSCYVSHMSCLATVVLHCFAFDRRQPQRVTLVDPCASSVDPSSRQCRHLRPQPPVALCCIYAQRYRQSTACCTSITTSASVSEHQHRVPCHSLAVQAAAVR